MVSRKHGLPAALLVVYLVSALATAGCGAAKAQYTSTPMSPVAQSTTPPPLDHSVFSKDPDGSLTEEALQKILDAPLEADFPGRVGVLPIITAKMDWRGPGPSYTGVPVAAGSFVKALRGSENFTMITEVMPIPSGSLGMEALREVAARYRLRYILLYREEIQHATRANEWALGYATILGAFFLPGETLHADGFTEASLFDVKTGAFLFTVRRRVSARVQENEWHTQDKLNSLHVKLAVKSAPDLAKDVKAATNAYQASAKIENERIMARWQEREEQRLQQQQQQPPAGTPPTDAQLVPSDAPTGNTPGNTAVIATP